MREELIKRARQFTAEHEHYEFYTAVAYSGYNHAIDKLNEMMATFAADVLAEREAEIAEMQASVRYALATFRALDRYTFEDSDHGLLIAEAVKKLEENNETSKND